MPSFDSYRPRSIRRAPVVGNGDVLSPQQVNEFNARQGMQRNDAFLAARQPQAPRQTVSRYGQSAAQAPGIATTGKPIYHVQRPDGSLVPVAAISGDRALIDTGKHFISPSTGKRFVTDPASATGMRDIGTEAEEIAAKAAAAQAKIAAKEQAAAAKAAEKGADEAQKLANAQKANEFTAQGRAFYYDKVTGEPRAKTSDAEFAANQKAEGQKLAQAAAAAPFKKRLAELDLELSNPDLPKVSEKDLKDAKEAIANAEASLIELRGNENYDPLTEDELKAALTDPAKERAAKELLAAREQEKQFAASAESRKKLEREAYEIKKRVLDPIGYENDLKAAVPNASPEELDAREQDIGTRVATSKADIAAKQAKLDAAEKEHADALATAKQRYTEATQTGDPNALKVAGENLQVVEQAALAFEEKSQAERDKLSAEVAEVNRDVGHLGIISTERKRRQQSAHEQTVAAFEAAAPGMGSEYQSLVDDGSKRAEALRKKYAGREDSPEAKAAFDALQKDITGKAEIIKGEVETRQKAKSENLDRLWNQFGVGQELGTATMRDWVADKSTDPEYDKLGGVSSMPENFKAKIKELGLDEKEARNYMETRRQLDWSSPLDPQKSEQGAELTRPLREKLGITDMLEPVRRLPNGAIIPNPVLGGDEEAFKASIEATDGTPEQKTEAMKLWPSYRRQYGEGLLSAFAKQSAFGEDFTEWRDSGKAKSTDPVEQALQYQDEMKGRSIFRRWGDLIASNVTAGFMDVTQAALGSAAALTSSEILSRLAAANSENAGSLVNTQDQLSNTGLAGSITATIARMAPGVAATVGTGTMAGGMIFGGMQTAGSLYGEAYNTLRESGKSHAEAWKAAAPASLAAGAMTAGLTKLFPGGVTALANNSEARASVRAMVAGFMSSGKAIAKGALDEIPEEVIDEAMSQLAQGYAEGRNPDDVVRDFITGLPELVVASGLMGGGMQALKDRQDRRAGGQDTAAPTPDGPLPEEVEGIKAAISAFNPTAPEAIQAMPAVIRAGPKNQLPSEITAKARASMGAVAGIASGEITKPSQLTETQMRALGVKLDKGGKLVPAGGANAPAPLIYTRADKAGNDQIVITDEARDWLKGALPDLAIGQSEAERIQAIENPPVAPKVKKPRKPKAEKPTVQPPPTNEPNQEAPLSPEPEIRQDMPESRELPVVPVEQAAQAPTPGAAGSVTTRPALGKAPPAQRKAIGKGMAGGSAYAEFATVDDADAFAYSAKLKAMGSKNVSPAKVKELSEDAKNIIIRVSKRLGIPEQEARSVFTDYNKAVREQAKAVREGESFHAPTLAEFMANVPRGTNEQQTDTKADILAAETAPTVGKTAPAEVDTAPADFQEYELRQIEQANRDAAKKALNSNSKTAAIIVDGNGVTLQMGDRQRHPTQNTSLTATVTDDQLTTDERREAKRISQENDLAETKEERAENRAKLLNLVRRVFERVFGGSATTKTPAEQSKTPPAEVDTKPATGGELIKQAHSRMNAVVKSASEADKPKAIAAAKAILDGLRRYNGHLPIVLTDDPAFDFAWGRREKALIINPETALARFVGDSTDPENAAAQAKQFFRHELIHKFVVSQLGDARVMDIWGQLPKEVQDQVQKAYSVRLVARGQKPKKLNPDHGGHEYYRAMLEAMKDGTMTEQVIGKDLADKWRKFLDDVLSLLRDLRKQFASIESESARNNLIQQVDQDIKLVSDAIDAFEKSISPDAEPAQVQNAEAGSTSGKPVEGSSTTVATPVSITNANQSSEDSTSNPDTQDLAILPPWFTEDAQSGLTEAGQQIIGGNIAGALRKRPSFAGAQVTGAADIVQERVDRAAQIIADTVNADMRKSKWFKEYSPEDQAKRLHGASEHKGWARNWLAAIDAKDAATLLGYNNSQNQGSWKVFQQETGIKISPNTDKARMAAIVQWVGQDAVDAAERAKAEFSAKKQAEQDAARKVNSFDSLKRAAADVRMQGADGNGAEWVEAQLKNGWRVVNISKNKIPQYRLAKDGAFYRTKRGDRGWKALLDYARALQAGMDEQAAKTAEPSMPEASDEEIARLFGQEAAPPTPAEQAGQFAAEDKAEFASLAEGLFASPTAPAQTFKAPIPPAKLGGFITLATKLASREGEQRVDSPAKVAAFIDEALPGGKARALSDAFWSAIRMTNPALPAGEVDWQSVYAELDQPKQPSRRDEIAAMTLEEYEAQAWSDAQRMAGPRAKDLDEQATRARIRETYSKAVAGKEVSSRPPSVEGVTVPSSEQGAAPASTKEQDETPFMRERNATIKASKEAGNVHLDAEKRYVENSRGREIYNVHDPKERGIIRTVSNQGEVVVHWSDKYSGEKNLATAKTEQQGRKKVDVLESWLMPTDLVDYVFADSSKPVTQAGSDTPPTGIISDEESARLDALSEENMQRFVKMSANQLSQLAIELGVRPMVFQRKGVDQAEVLDRTHPDDLKAALDVVTKPKAKADTPATAEAKVEEQVQVVAATEGQRDAKEIKKEIAEKLDAAIAAALENESPRAKELRTEIKGLEIAKKETTSASSSRNLTKQIGRLQKELDRETRSNAVITIQIPGDGTFKVFNNVETLRNIRKRVSLIVTDVAPDKPEGEAENRKQDALNLADASSERFGGPLAAIEWLKEQMADSTDSVKEWYQSAIDLLNKRKGDIAREEAEQSTPESESTSTAGVDESALNTPMMKQWRTLREPLDANTVLLVRLGDFYEAFGNDAKVLSELAKVALTKRNGIQMAGIPHHSATGYIQRLVSAGKRVAIAEQMGEIKPGAVTERKVTSITPEEHTPTEEAPESPDVAAPAAQTIVEREGWSPVGTFQGAGAINGNPVYEKNGTFATYWAFGDDMLPLTAAELTQWQKQAEPAAPVVKETAPTSIGQENVNAKHSREWSQVSTEGTMSNPRGTLRAAAIKSKTPSAPWYYPGDIRQLAFNQRAIVGGESAATPEGAQTLKEYSAAVKDGWSYTNVKAGSYGTVYVFRKNDMVLTNAGAAALTDEVMQRPEDVPEGRGGSESNSTDRLAQYSARLVEWLKTLPESTLNSPVALSTKMRNDVLAKWVKLREPDHKPLEWRLTYLKENGSADVQFFALSLDELIKKAINYAVIERDMPAADRDRGYGYPEFKDAPTVSETLASNGFAETQPTQAPEVVAEVQPITGFDSARAFIAKLRKGEVTAEQVRTAWEQLKAQRPAILADLMKMKVDELLPMAGMSARKSDGKASVAESALGSLDFYFNPDDSISYSYGGDFQANKDAAMDEKVAKWTDEMIVEQAQARREAAEASKAAKEKALTNPETKEEWEKFIYRRGRQSLSDADVKRILKIRGQSARMQEVLERGEKLLTPEELARYDAFVGINRKEKAQDAAEAKARVYGVDANTETDIIETTHTKKGYPLFVVKLADRVERPVYDRLNIAAKKLGGYYSSYRGNGATPGFQFRSRAEAEQFQAASRGETIDRTEAIQERQGEKKNAAAERLMAQADKLEASADEVLNADRQTNTARRARMAASAENAAESNKAMARTMRNLAEAIASGEATHLDGVNTKAHVATLEGLARSGKDKAETAEGLSYADREKRKYEPATPEQMAYASYPYPYLHKSDVLSMVALGEKTPGAKLLAARVAKIRFTTNEGEQGYLTDAGQIEEFRELAQKLTERGKPLWDTYAWKFESYDRVRRMGLMDLPSLRAALREFTQFRSVKARPDKLKEMERALIGQKLPGFFPTPRSVIDDMVASANLGEGMRVLEPSAGKGDIADAVREAGADVDVIERSGTLRDILTEKKFNIIGQDFMDETPSPVYDAVLMNPPFEDGAEMRHVRHAYDFLKPGGKLIAVMSEGPFGRSDKASAEFREWLDTVGTSERLPQGTFASAEAFRQTGVSTRLVTITKPAPLQASPTALGIDEDGETDVLQTPPPELPIASVIQSFEAAFPTFSTYMDENQKPETRKEALRQIVKAESADVQAWREFANLDPEQALPEDAEAIREAKELLPEVESMQDAGIVITREGPDYLISKGDASLNLRIGDAERWEDLWPEDALERNRAMASVSAIRVPASQRKNGIGRLLMSTADELARKEGAANITLKAVALMGAPDPSGFYEALGYRQITETEDGEPIYRKAVTARATSQPKVSIPDLHAAFVQAKRQQGTDSPTIRAVFDAAKVKNPRLSRQDFVSAIRNSHYTGLVTLKDGAGSIQVGGKGAMSFLPITEAEIMDAADNATETPEAILEAWAATTDVVEESPKWKTVDGRTWLTEPEAKATGLVYYNIEPGEDGLNDPVTEEEWRNLQRGKVYDIEVEPLQASPSGSHYTIPDQNDPLKRHSKHWLSSSGRWYAVTGEHSNAAMEIEQDGASLDDAVRVVLESHANRLFYEGSPNKKQMRELRDAAILHRLELSDDYGNIEPLQASPTSRRNVANQASNLPGQRDAWDALSQTYEDKELETVSYQKIEAAIDEVIAEQAGFDRLYDQIVGKMRNGIDLSLEEDIARRMIARVLWIEGNDNPASRTKAKLLFMADMREASETARKLGSRVDKAQTPQQRLDNAMRNILSPSSKMIRERLVNVWSGAEKLAAIKELERRLASTQDTLQRERAERELEKAKARQDQNEVMEQMAQEDDAKVDAILKRQGLTQADLFLSVDDRFAMQEAVIEMTRAHMGQQSEKHKKAIEMSVRGYSDAAISKETGLPLAEVSNTAEHFRNVVAKQAIAKEVSKGGTFSKIVQEGKKLISWILQASPTAPLGSMVAKGTPTAAAVAAQIQAILNASIPTKGQRNAMTFHAATAKGKNGQRVKVLVPYDPADWKQVYRTARELSTREATWLDKGYEYWINGILSGPQTHVVNTASNVLSTFWAYGPQWFSEATMNVLIRDPNSPQLGEFKHVFAGFWKGVMPALRNFALAWSTEADPVEHQYLDKPVTAMFQGGNLDKVGGIRPSIGGAFGRIVRVPGRFLVAQDAFAKTLIMHAESAAMAYRLGKKQDLEGAALTNFIAKQVATHGSESWQHAFEKAVELTFQDENDITKAVESVSNSLKRAKLVGWLFKFMLPFVRTPTNIYRAGIRKAGGSAGMLLYRLGKSGYYAIKGNNNEFRSYREGKMVKDVSESVMALVLWYFIMGMSEGDDDDNQKAIEITGSRPFGVANAGERASQLRQEGGSNLVIIRKNPLTGEKLDEPLRLPYGRYEPIALAVSTLVDGVREFKEWSRLKPQDRTTNALAGSISKHLLAQAKDKTFLQGISGFMDFLEDMGGKNLSLQDIAMKNLFNGAIPNLIRQPYRNIQDTVADSKKADSELSRSLGIGEAKVNEAGKPVTRQGNIVSRVLFPVPTTPSTSLFDSALKKWNASNPRQTWNPDPLTKGDWYVYDPKLGSQKGKVALTDSRQISLFETMVGLKFASLAARALVKEGYRPGQPVTPKMFEAIKAARSDAITATRQRHPAEFRTSKP